jgi:hypothetical protein
VPIGNAAPQRVQFAQLPTGGCGFLEDPTLDSRSAHPCWRPDPPAVIRIEPDDRDANGTRFSLWTIPGSKRLAHDGTRLRLCAELSAIPVRLSIASAVQDDAPFAFAIPAATDMRVAWGNASRLTTCLSEPQASSQRRVTLPPTRNALLHMRALQALDGALAGASHRDIGVALFGVEAINQRWDPDSELRAQVRHLIRRARALMTAGYRELIRSPTHAGR